MANENILTLEGKKQLEAELRELLDVKRPNVIKQLQEARQQGDLSENADYDSAKNEQANIEKRINEIKDILANSTLIGSNKTKRSSSSVKIGSTITILDMDSKAKESFTIVGETEANPANRKISNVSPLALAVLGKEIGVTVEVKHNMEKPYKVKILEIK